MGARGARRATGRTARSSDSSTPFRTDLHGRLPHAFAHDLGEAVVRADDEVRAVRGRPHHLRERTDRRQRGPSGDHVPLPAVLPGEVAEIPDEPRTAGTRGREARRAEEHAGRRCDDDLRPRSVGGAREPGGHQALGRGARRARNAAAPVNGAIRRTLAPWNVAPGAAARVRRRVGIPGARRRDHERELLGQRLRHGRDTIRAREGLGWKELRDEGDAGAHAAHPANRVLNSAATTLTSKDSATRCRPDAGQPAAAARHR